MIRTTSKVLSYFEIEDIPYKFITLDNIPIDEVEHIIKALSLVSQRWCIRPFEKVLVRTFKPLEKSNHDYSTPYYQCTEQDRWYGTGLSILLTSTFRHQVSYVSSFLNLSMGKIYKPLKPEKREEYLNSGGHLLIDKEWRESEKRYIHHISNITSPSELYPERYIPFKG